MKEGTQYSHYCGTELNEILCLIRSAMNHIDDKPEASKDILIQAKKEVRKLRDKISELDVINNMER